MSAQKSGWRARLGTNGYLPAADTSVLFLDAAYYFKMFSYNSGVLFNYKSEAIKPETGDEITSSQIALSALINF